MFKLRSALLCVVQERLEALMRRSLERSLQLEQRSKRWSRAGAGKMGVIESKDILATTAVNGRLSNVVNEKQQDTEEKSTSLFRQTAFLLYFMHLNVVKCRCMCVCGKQIDSLLRNSPTSEEHM